MLATIAQKTADIAPTALGIAGGIVGMGAGPAGMAAMGMAGGAAGMGYRNLIEHELLGKPYGDPSKEWQATVDRSGDEGASLLTAEGLIRGTGKLGKAAMQTQAAQKMSAMVAEKSAPLVKYVSEFTDSVKKEVIKPVTDYLEANMAQKTPEVSGDAIKEKLGARIKPMFDQFKQRYAEINSIAAETPMTDSARLSLSEGLRNDARGLPSNLYNMVKRYADKIDSAGNAQQVHGVISEVNGEIARLQQRSTSSAMRDQLSTLQQFSDRATDHMENFTYGIAKRISQGKASMPEMQAFEKMMVSQANPTVATGEQNAAKYAKSVADDYIAKRNSVNMDYSKFRGFLEDVGEQTGTKARGRGPMQFIQQLRDVPSEQLAERAANPKNAAALRAMQKEVPEVFAEVKQAQIRSVYNKSMEDGSVSLKKLADNFEALPESMRGMIISPAELKTIRAVADSTNLKAIDAMQKSSILKITNEIKNIVHAGALFTGKIAKDTAGTRPVQATINRAVGGPLLNAFGPQQPEQP